MPRTKTKPVAEASTSLRRCVGSKTFGIEAHEAPTGDFPVQPSRKDGLGVMCKSHWTQYTGALRKAALARKAAQAEPVAEPEAPAKAPRTRKVKVLEPLPGSQGDAG